MDHEAEVRISALLVVAFLFYATYRWEFELKRLWSSVTKCRKTGHRWITVYGRTQQCRVCYKVLEMSREVCKW
jgi:hypothetical protein